MRNFKDSLLGLENFKTVKNFKPRIWSFSQSAFPHETHNREGRGEQGPIRGLGWEYQPMRSKKTLSVWVGAWVAITILSYPQYTSVLLRILQMCSNRNQMMNSYQMKILYKIFNFSHVDIFVDSVYSVFYNTKA